MEDQVVVYANSSARGGISQGLCRPWQEGRSDPAGRATPNRFSFQRARLATESVDDLDPSVGVFCYPGVYGSRPAGRLGRSRGVGGRSTGVRGRSAGSGRPPTGSGRPPTGSGRPPTGSGRPPTGSSHPPAGVFPPPADRDGVLADAGQWLAGSGRSPGDTGRSPAGPGQTPRDAGRSIAAPGRSTADAGRSTADAGRSMADAGRSPPESGEPCLDRPLPPEIDGRICASVGIGVLCGSFSPGDRRSRGEGRSLTTESDRGREPNRLRS